MATTDEVAPIGTSGRKRLLHVGCGPPWAADGVPPLDYEREWEAIRVDIDPDVEPDIVADIVTLAPIPDGWAHFIFAKHVVEHIEPHQVTEFFRTFNRVLAPGGYLVIRTPDLAAACRLVLSEGPETPIYRAKLGSRKIDVTAHDILYGSRQLQAEGSTFMAHRCGFTAASMEAHLAAAGFVGIGVTCDTRLFELKCFARKPMNGDPLGPDAG